MPPKKGKKKNVGFREVSDNKWETQSTTSGISGYSAASRNNWDMQSTASGVSGVSRMSGVSGVSGTSYRSEMVQQPEEPIPEVPSGMRILATVPPAASIPAESSGKDNIKNLKVSQSTFFNLESFKMLMAHEDLVEKSIKCVSNLTKELTPLSELKWPDPFVDNNDSSIYVQYIDDAKKQTTMSIIAQNMLPSIESNKKLVVLHPDCLSWEVILQNIISEFLSYPKEINDHVVLANSFSQQPPRISEKKSRNAENRSEFLRLNKVIEKDYKTGDFNSIFENFVSSNMGFRIFSENKSLVEAFILSYLLNSCEPLNKDMTVYMVVQKENVIDMDPFKNDIDQIDNSQLEALSELINEAKDLYPKVFDDKKIEKAEDGDAKFEAVLTYETNKSRPNKLLNPFFSQDEKTFISKQADRNIDQIKADVFADSILKDPAGNPQPISRIRYQDNFKNFFLLKNQIEELIKSLSEENLYRYLYRMKVGDNLPNNYRSKSFWTTYVSKENAINSCLYKTKNCDTSECILVEIQLSAGAQVLFSMTDDGGRVIIGPCSSFKYKQQYTRGIDTMDSVVFKYDSKSDISSSQNTLFKKMMYAYVINQSQIKSSVRTNKEGKKITNPTWITRGDLVNISQKDFDAMKSYLTCKRSGKSSSRR